MRNPKTLEIFYDRFKEVHIKYFPDFRPGQLWLDYLGFVHAKYGDSFFLEYDEMLKCLDEYVKDANPYFKGSDLFTNDRKDN